MEKAILNKIVEAEGFENIYIKIVYTKRFGLMEVSPNTSFRANY